MPIHNPPRLIIPKEHGRSSSETPKDGVTVVFTKEFSTVPRVSMCPWQKGGVWLTEVTTTGFIWEGDKKSYIVDWIAVGEI